MAHPDDYDYDRGNTPPQDRNGDGGYDDYEEPGNSRQRLVRRARERVNLPAIFLIVTALLGLAMAAMVVALVWAAPDAVMRDYYDMMQQWFPNQQLPTYEEFVKQQQVQSTVVNSIRIVVSVIILVGAMKMRALRGYGWAMAASVISIVPFCPSECCFTLPFGIWALIVLLNGDVKRAFQLAARTESLG